MICSDPSAFKRMSGPKPSHENEQKHLHLCLSGHLFRYFPWICPLSVAVNAVIVYLINYLHWHVPFQKVTHFNWKASTFLSCFLFFKGLLKMLLQSKMLRHPLFHYYYYFFSPSNSMLIIWIVIPACPQCFLTSASIQMAVIFGIFALNCFSVVIAYDCIMMTNHTFNWKFSYDVYIVNTIFVK